jgi:hypothetical protein
MADCIIGVPLTLCTMYCCFKHMDAACPHTSKISPTPYDDERPRKATPYEIEMYNAHMKAYGHTK